MTKGDIKKILLRNNEMLNKYQVKSIALFGSYVRNEQNKKSDIDFIVEFYNNTYNNFIHLTFDLEKVFRRKVNVVTTGGLSPYILPYVKKEAELIIGEKLFAA